MTNAYSLRLIACVTITTLTTTGLARTHTPLRATSPDQRYMVIVKEVPKVPLSKATVYQIIDRKTQGAILNVPSSYNPSDPLEKDYYWGYAKNISVFWNRDSSLVAMDEQGMHGYGQLFIAKVSHSRNRATLLDLPHGMLVMRTKESWIKVRVAVDDAHPERVWIGRRRLRLWIVGSAKASESGSGNGISKCYETILEFSRNGLIQVTSFRDVTDYNQQ